MSITVLLTVVALHLTPAAEPAASGKGAVWNPVTFANVLTGLPKAYYDPKRLPPKRAFVAALTRLERAVPELLVSGPDAKGELRVTARGKERRFGSADLTTWMAMGDRLLTALRWIDGVLGDPSHRGPLQYAVIKGVLSVLDPHTVFYTPEEYRQQQSRFTGSMVGIGVLLATQGGRIVVSRLVPGGPAAKAGLRVGDVLVQVDALRMTNLSPSIVAGRLRGKAGTKVVVVLRRGRRTHRFTLVRREIVLPSVKARMLPGRVALVAVTGFPKNALASFEKAIAPIRRRKPRAWILDLRGNEGGYILQAARMADHFLPKGQICKAVGRGGQKVVTWEVKPKPTRITGPVVVLINRRTASAAEILSGTLSVNQRALLLGERTWGKGTVQKLYNMPDKSALKLTMWQYLLAGDIPIQTAAIVPDIELRPVTLRKGDLRFITAGRVENEASQAGRIDAMGGKAAWKGRPVLPYVRYLHSGDDKEDPVLALARRIALAAKGTNRQALLTAARPLVEALRAKQGTVIRARLLKTHGVTWSTAKSPVKKPHLVARFEQPTPTVKAGALLTLRLTVENKGSAPAVRVSAVLAGYHAAIKGREVLFGGLAPGERRTRKIPIRLPEGLRSRREQIRARVTSGAHANLVVAHAVVDIQERPRPGFQLSWQIDDRRHGNGDGRLGPGETAEVLLVVKNTGPGPAAQVRADATDPTPGLAITRARALFAKLPAGATATARLALKLAKDTGGKRPGFTVTVYDRMLGADLSVPVRLPLPKTTFDFAAAKTVVSPRPGTLRLSAYAGPDAPVVGVVPTSARLAVEARRGAWLRVAGLPQGRIGFVSKGDVKDAKGPARLKGFEPHWHAVAPRIDVQGAPAVAAARTVTLRGLAASTRGVQDLWVRVWNPEAKQPAVDKVHYTRGPEGGLRQLKFDAPVPLQPGTNYVVVDARDVTGVQGQRRMAIYLPPRSDTLTPRPKALAPKASDRRGKKDRKKEGCGCGQTQGAAGLAGLWLGLALWLARRRRSAPGLPTRGEQAITKDRGQGP